MSSAGSSSDQGLEHAREYGALRRRLVPAFDGSHGAALRARGPEQRVLDLGASEAGRGVALERMAHDRCATVPARLRWLEAAGSDGVGCPWRDGRFAALTGRRPS